MLVRLNGKSVYRSFLSLCHTHAHSLPLSHSSIGPGEQSDTIHGPLISVSFLFPHFSPQLSLFSRPAHIERSAKNNHKVFPPFFAGFVEMLPWTARRVLETSEESPEA